MTVPSPAPFVPYWESDPDVWDTCLLGQIELPGVARVDVKRGLDIDKKKAKGKDRARLTIQGRRPADVTITVRLLGQESFGAMVDILPRLEPKPDAKPESDCWDIAHPVAAMRGVQSVMIEEIEGPQLVDGILEVKIKCVEFNPPPKPQLMKGGGGVPQVYGFVGTFQLEDGSYVSAQARQLAGTPGVGTFETKDGKPAKIIKGKFLAQDDLLAKEIFDKELAAADKRSPDATRTPDTSKGVDLGKIAPPPDVPDPATQNPWD